MARAPAIATFADLERWLDARRVTEIECLVPDLAGVARGKILPRERFTDERGLRLPEGTIALSVTGEEPRGRPFVDIVRATDPDMHLQPDLATVRIVPWATEPTAQIIHDCFDRDGKMVRYAPRSVLRRVCDLYREAGWSPEVAPELEFYLVARSSDPNAPLESPVGRSGRSETSRQSYSIDAVNEFDPLFEDVYGYCKQMDLGIDTLIHETGAGQMEINFSHADPMSLADEVFFFKRTLREAALRHDMHATFMAKPLEGEPGSAMHVHQSIVDKAGRNLFSTEGASRATSSAGTSAACSATSRRRWRCSRPTSTATAGSPATPRRRSTSTGAPTTARSASACRSSGPAARRIENRVIGADANPYIAIAATLACGWLGIRERIEPSAECTEDAYQRGYTLARSLGEALELLREDGPCARSSATIS